MSIELLPEVIVVERLALYHAAHRAHKRYGPLNYGWLLCILCQFQDELKEGVYHYKI